MRLAEELQRRKLVADGEDLAAPSNGGIPHQEMHDVLVNNGYKLTVPSGPGKGVALYSNPEQTKTVTVHHDGRFVTQKHGEIPKSGKGHKEFKEKLGIAK